MYKGNWILLLITVFVGVLAFSEFAAASAGILKGVFVLFLLLSLGSFLTGYREKCCR